MDKLAALQPDQWVNKYGDILFSYTIVRINDSGIAEDIVQDTFFSAWKARENYHGQASEKNWLFAICKNKIIDYYRKKSGSFTTAVSGEENEYFDDAEHWAPATCPNEWMVDFSFKNYRTIQRLNCLPCCETGLPLFHQARFEKLCLFHTQ